jgi:hypothetical protein
MPNLETSMVIHVFIYNFLSSNALVINSEQFFLQLLSYLVNEVVTFLRYEH